MSNLGSRYNYKQLLDHHDVIRIPMIQRDYAQGRPAVAQVRDEFLSAIEVKLKLPSDHPSLPMNLDFIYGSVTKSNEESRFEPLDGQQRLTTLFLLHWYLAWKDDRLSDFMKMFAVGDRSRFSYSVRQSSNEFFDELVQFEPRFRPEEIPKLSQFIANQTWYFLRWRLDPTVQSVLSMLDAIHVRFADSINLFDRLVDEKQPAITFQLLDLDNFGLSDDLYIKMNARGKPLTPFETFKARYEQELKNQSVAKTRKIGGQNFPIHEFVARRMDTTWLDLFWASDHAAASIVDESMFNVFRVVALISRDPELDSCLRDVTRLTKELPNYTVFHDSGWLDDAFTETLIPLLEIWCNKGDGLRPLLPNSHYFDELEVFRKITRNPLSLDVPEILLFMGYALFIRERESLFDADELQKWMRIVHNLIRNSNIDRTDRLPSGLRAVRTLLPQSNSILEHLAGKPSRVGLEGLVSQQLDEESIKAALILNHVGWQPLIDQAEHHGYFRGQIDFLLDFCGVVDFSNTKHVPDWDDTTHAEFQAIFRQFLEKAVAMFDAKGLVNAGKFDWQRALLSIGNYLLPMGNQNESFLVDSPTEPYSWKRLLRGYLERESRGRELLGQLWENLDMSRPIAIQLNELIDAATGLEPWRAALVSTPAAVAYCGKTAIRRNSESEVYLLAKSQMNGEHAELFTYCLNEKNLRDNEITFKLKPLVVDEYFFSTETMLEPGCRLVYRHGDGHLRFKVEYTGSNFVVDVLVSGLKDAADLQAFLMDEIGFEIFATYWIRKCYSRDDIETGLIELAAALATISLE